MIIKLVILELDLAVVQKSKTWTKRKRSADGLYLVGKCLVKLIMLKLSQG